MHPLNKKVKFMKDSIDFGSMEIPKLFRKLLIPTVLGMVFSAVFVITDGIFVGQGIGSDALAAVNITAPLFLISTGIGLMFGVGASVVASIHLSQGKLKTARIYNPQIQISAESETKRSIFREKDKTKRSKKESAQHSKSRNKSFVMTSVSAL